MLAVFGAGEGFGNEFALASERSSTCFETCEHSCVPLFALLCIHPSISCGVFKSCPAAAAAAAYREIVALPLASIEEVLGSEDPVLLEQIRSRAKQHLESVQRSHQHILVNLKQSSKLRKLLKRVSMLPNGMCPPSTTELVLAEAAARAAGSGSDRRSLVMWHALLLLSTM